MTYKRIGTRGVLSLEGAWEEDLRDRSSVLYTLQMLESLGRTSYIHRDVATNAELFDYLNRAKAKTRYAHFEILHLAFHGERGRLSISPREEVDLSALAEGIRQITERRAIEVVYFGSCLTMSASEADLDDFVRASGVRHAVGHTRSVEWIEAAGFELMALDALSYFSRVGDGINFLQRGALGDFGRSLGFTRFPR